MSDRVEFDELKGKILTDIRGLENGSDNVMFKTTEEDIYHMFHYQD
jgi:hypothetical protein